MTDRSTCGAYLRAALIDVCVLLGVRLVTRAVCVCEVATHVDDQSCINRGAEIVVVSTVFLT